MWSPYPFVVVILYKPTNFHNVLAECCKMLSWKETELDNRTELPHFAFIHQNQHLYKVNRISTGKATQLKTYTEWPNKQSSNLQKYL